MTYKIRVRDHLDVSWANWFEGWEFASLEGGDILLTSSDADRSALHGALNKIRDLNLELISVVSISHEGTEPGESSVRASSCESTEEEGYKENSHERSDQDHSQQ